ncbi:hypothetical protein evm_009824 [Chilo suppressalis]|nr:hypothetical protein evm_009824 [Chilo suppressalis]
MWWLCVVLCFGLTFCAENETAYDETPQLDYYSMPALSELDDFDLCLRKPESIYCIVDFVLMEDETPLYQFIKNHSSMTYTNYKYSKLHRGVCASKACGLNVSHADGGETAIAALKDCFNASIHQQYGLQVEKLSLRYCKTQSDYLPYDALDFIIGAILLLLLLVNFGCSAYFYFWPTTEIRVVPQSLFGSIHSKNLSSDFVICHFRH